MRVPCDDVDVKIGFVAFSDAVTDSLILRQFEKSTNFQKLVDTAVITQANGSYKKFKDTLLFEYSFNAKHGYTGNEHSLTSGYDHELYLPAINKTFKISDIEEQYTMRTLGCTFKNSGCYNYIKGYKIDGRKIIGEFKKLTIYFHQ